MDCKYKDGIEYDLKGIFENGLPCCEQTESCPYNLGAEFNLSGEKYHYCTTGGDVPEKSKLLKLTKQQSPLSI